MPRPRWLGFTPVMSLPSSAIRPQVGGAKPAGSVRIRVETIAAYLERMAGGIIERKRAAAATGRPLPDR